MGQNTSFINCNRLSDVEQSSFVKCIDYKTQRMNYREALQIAEQGMKKFPYSYSLRLDKALLLEKLGNTSAAQNELIGLIQIYPEKQELHNYLGRIFYDKDKSKSLLALLKSIAIEPNNELSKENLIFVKRLLNGGGAPRNFKSQKKLYARTKNDFELVNYRLEYLPKHNHPTMENVANRLEIFFEALTNSSSRKEGFFWEYYAPYYIDFFENNSTKNFTFYIFGEESDLNIE